MQQSDCCGRASNAAEYCSVVIWTASEGTTQSMIAVSSAATTTARGACPSPKASAKTAAVSCASCSLADAPGCVMRLSARCTTSAAFKVSSVCGQHYRESGWVLSRYSASATDEAFVGIKLNLT